MNTSRSKNNMNQWFHFKMCFEKNMLLMRLRKWRKALKKRLKIWKCKWS